MTTNKNISAINNIKIMGIIKVENTENPALNKADVIRSAEYRHLWDLMDEINTIMRESYMIEGREFGRTEGYKIMGRLEQWAEHH